MSSHTATSRPHNKTSLVPQDILQFFVVQPTYYSLVHLLAATTKAWKHMVEPSSKQNWTGSGFLNIIANFKYVIILRKKEFKMQEMQISFLALETGRKPCPT